MKFNVPDTGEGLLPVIEVGDIFGTLPKKERKFYQVLEVSPDQECKCINIESKRIKMITNTILLNNYAYVKRGSICK